MPVRRQLPGYIRRLIQDPVNPVVGFAVIFVAYEGFQLLCYDYSDIKNVEKNLEYGMYTAIVTAILVYVSVSYMATLHLTPQMIAQHKEYALAKAVTPYLGQLGFALVVVTAIQSTASGINATLFGSSRLAHRIATEKELPRVFSFRNRKGIPTYALLITGSLTVVFTWFGSLEQITEFGSVAFLVADGAANFANLRLYEKTDSNPLIPLLGFTGTLVALPIVIHHLYVTEPTTLLHIVSIFTPLIVFEFLYLERDPIENEVEKMEEEAERVEEEVKQEVHDLEDRDS
ncbi:MAG: APC family permease [Candidatus Nanohaloarchaea archaeon]